MSNWVVITSIYPPRIRLNEYIRYGWNVVVVGDAKTKNLEWEKLEQPQIHFLSLARQNEIYPEISRLLELNSYARKNLGYLYAIQNGAERIFDTDDDTFLRSEFWDCYRENFDLKNSYTTTKSEWFNPYSYFAPSDKMWPRGFPLTEISNLEKFANDFLQVGEENSQIDVIQTLVNGEPDVDAIYRLIHGNIEINHNFSNEIIGVNWPTLAPGNTQSTFWLNKNKFHFYLFLPPCLLGSQIFLRCTLLKPM